MQENIWDPLSLKNITFHQELKPAVAQNLVKLSVRLGIPDALAIPAHNDEKVEFTDRLVYDNPTKYEYGGQGAIASATEYFEIVKSLLFDDGKLLKSETVDEMFKPQLSEPGRKQFDMFNAYPVYKDAFASHPAGTKIDYGLGGMLVLEEEATGRKSGTLSWSGLINSAWSIDRETGLALFYASNLLPFGDFKSGDYHRLFEREMYDRYAEFLKK